MPERGDQYGLEVWQRIRHKLPETEFSRFSGFSGFSRFWGFWAPALGAAALLMIAAFVGGRTWQRQANGLPAAQAWWTVKRQAMAADTAATVGIYFATTSGEVWGSRDEGRSWKRLAQHLPHIYALECA